MPVCFRGGKNRHRTGCGCRRYVAADASGSGKTLFERFTKRLPDVEALAECPEDELLKLWEGLGYYNRVRNMQKAAVQVMEEHGGKLPADYEKLLKLKGIGSYTAGAIASIAYQIPVPAVDGNVFRILTRVAADDTDIMKPSFRTLLGKRASGSHAGNGDAGGV